MPIEAIIFDLDDTLYEEIQFVHSGFQKVARYISNKYNYACNFVYNELLSDFNKGIREKNFDVLLKNLKINEDELEHLIEIYRYHHPIICLSNDSRVILPILQNNYKLGLITDGYLLTQKNKIDALGVELFFDNIIINDSAKGVDKFSEKPFRQMINAVDIFPHKSLFIGDNPNKDFFIPKKLGMHTVRIKREKGIYSNIPKNIKIDFEISNLLELIHLLDIM
ncbi:MAG: dUMP phosphatase [Syntrophorhabdus sp. PtaB.Bin027]|nr:MAG: dUMP phosphatase [Syntrophorhabdus sp. PtaB.Bin027]